MKTADKVALFEASTGFVVQTDEGRRDLFAFFDNSIDMTKFNALEWVGDFLLNYCASRFVEYYVQLL